MRLTNITGMLLTLIVISSAGLAQPQWGWEKKVPGREILEVPKKSDSDAAWQRYYQWRAGLAKITGEESRRSGIHKGNRVRTLFYNYGTIGQPRTEPSLEWPIGSNQGYGFEFGVMVGAKVRAPSGAQYKIISEGITDGGDVSPDGMAWGWQPLAGYVDQTQDFLPLSNDLDNDGPDGIPGSSDDDKKPDTWPPRQTTDNPFWYSISDPNNDNYPGFYVWPGEYGKGITTADEESFYVMDDYWNKEFNLYDPNAQEGSTYTDSLNPIFYYPDENDKRRGGLGFQVESRGYQWTNTLAQDCIFFIYEIKNVVSKDVDNTYFGMFGDPHVGGANDYSDDDAFYDTKLDMVYAWDHDFCGERTCWRPGYFGYKFLESPGDPYDNRDNDEDGLVDERMDDGIDNDGDWLSFSDLNGNGRWDEDEPLNDDVGSDGISPLDAHYPGPDDDGSEANGMPDAGEPNFDETDLDEADQIGLTSFRVYEYGVYEASYDETFYNFIAAETIDSTTFEQNRDNVFLYSSGPITLKPNDIGRFSIALLFGYDQTDLYRSANIVQEIYNAGYRFVKPPNSPRITAVAGDGEVTLYWDHVAEYSRDPVYGYDFEGYRIYRSTDYAFNEVYDVTDAQGNPKLWKPIAQFDIDNHISGPHPVESINGIHYYMGDNTGLVHSFKDTTVMNGMQYFYAVVSYDSGAAGNSIPPSECSKQITYDAFTGNYVLSRNTTFVTPQAPSVGYVESSIDYTNFPKSQDKGSVSIQVIDPEKVTGHTYEFRINDWATDDEDNNNNWEPFSDLDSSGTWDPGEPLNDDMGLDGLGPGDTGYTSPDSGEGDGIPTNGEPNFNQRDFGEIFGPTISYSLYDETTDSFAIKKSPYLNGEDYNPYVHGLKVTVNDVETSVNEDSSGWIAGNAFYDWSVSPYLNSNWSGHGLSNFYVRAPYDYKITVFDTVVAYSDIPAGRPMNFVVTNETLGDTATLIYYGKPQIVHDTDIIIAHAMENTFMGAWKIKFNSPMTNATHVFEDETGIWMPSVKDGGNVGKGIGLFRPSSGRFNVYNSALGLRNNHVNAAAKNWDDQYWCATPSGISVWNFNNFYDLYDAYLTDTECRDILLDDNNWLWIATKEGITAINLVPSLAGQDTNVTFIKTDPLDPGSSLISDNVYSLLMDDQNRVWAGTNSGISVFSNITDTTLGINPVTFDTCKTLEYEVVNYDTDDGLLNSSFTRLFQDSVGWIFAGTNSGFNVYDTTTATWITVTTGLSAQKVSCFEEVDGKIWVGTPGGINIYDPETDAFVDTLSYGNGELTNNTVTSILNASDGIVYVFNEYGIDFRVEGQWNSVNPKGGDVFEFRTIKKLTSEDNFTFTTSSEMVDTASAKENISKVAVVPNPYVAAAVWEPRMDFVTGGHERRVFFINLPAKCTVRIFTMNGELVKTIKVDNKVSNGAVSWNLLNEDNLEIAYGVYIFHVKAPGIGDQIGKFAIIK